MEYPACEKLAKIAPTTQIIMEFLNWLSNTKQTHLVHDHEGYSSYINAPEVVERMEEYFENDMKAVEAERCEMIERLSQ